MRPVGWDKRSHVQAMKTNWWGKCFQTFCYLLDPDPSSQEDEPSLGLLWYFFFFNVRCKHLNKTDQQEVESAFSRWVEYHLVSSLTKMHVRKCERCCSILIGDIKGIVLVNNNVISRSFSMERRWYANPNGFTLLLLQCQCINKGNNPTYDKPEF